MKNNARLGWLGLLALTVCLAAPMAANTTNSTNSTVNTTINMTIGSMPDFGGHYFITLTPTINRTASGYVVTNVTPQSNFSVSFYSANYSISEIGLTPSYANLTIDGAPYNLALNQTEGITDYIRIELTGVSWGPITTSTFNISEGAPSALAAPIAITNATVSSASSTSSSSTVAPTTTIEPAPVPFAAAPLGPIAGFIAWLKSVL